MSFETTDYPKSDAVQTTVGQVAMPTQTSKMVDGIMDLLENTFCVDDRQTLPPRPIDINFSLVTPDTSDHAEKDEVEDNELHARAHALFIGRLVAAPWCDVSEPSQLDVNMIAVEMPQKTIFQFGNARFVQTIGRYSIPDELRQAINRSSLLPIPANGVPNSVKYTFVSIK